MERKRLREGAFCIEGCGRAEPIRLVSGWDRRGRRSRVPKKEVAPRVDCSCLDRL